MIIFYSLISAFADTSVAGVRINLFYRRGYTITSLASGIIASAKGSGISLRTRSGLKGTSL